MKKVFAVDEKLYWNFVTDLLCEMTENSDQDYSYYVEELKKQAKRKLVNTN